MNEWQLQQVLTRRWSREGLNYGTGHYDLVCWELMFPSWTINDKNATWNEPSIDFIFFNGVNALLCVELKTDFKTKRNLLMAYCQVLNSSVEFSKSYTPEKLENAKQLCFSGNPSARLEPEDSEDILSSQASFPEKHLVKPVLAVPTISDKLKSELEEMNAMDLPELQAEVENYTLNKTFARFSELEPEDMEAINDKKVGLVLIEL